MKIELNANELNMVLRGLDKYINDCLESAANADQLKSNILSAITETEHEKPTLNKESIAKAAAKYREKERSIDKYRNIHEKRRWEEDEIRYLKIYYGKDETKNIAEHLHRSRCAVRQKAMELGIAEKRE